MLPYLLLVPAVILELLIHIVPMLVGIGISFLKLTQFYIANWSQAPNAGLANYRYALDFNGAAGKQLLHSFFVTIIFTVVVLACPGRSGWRLPCSPNVRFPGGPSSARSSSSRTPCRSSRR